MPRKVKNNKNKNSNKRPKQKRSMKPSAKRRNQPVTRLGPSSLSACAAKYALALGSPFSPQALGACVPTFPARPSQKVHSRVFGTFQVGSGGVGFIGHAPTVCNNLNSIYYSRSGFTLTTADITAIGVTQAPFDSIPYSTAQIIPTATTGEYLSNTVRGRVVCSAMRIRYVGTELNRSGVIYGLVTPDHSNMQNSSIPQMTKYRECIRRPVSRSWTTLCACAIDPDEADYPDISAMQNLSQSNQAFIEASYPFSGGNYLLTTAQGIGGIPMLFLVTGAAFNEFEFEIITHLEYTGGLIQQLLSPSHADIAGLSKVIDLKAQSDLSAASNTASKPYEQTFAETCKASVNNFVDQAVSVMSVAGTVASGASQLRSAYKGLKWVEV